MFLQISDFGKMSGAPCFKFSTTNELSKNRRYVWVPFFEFPQKHVWTKNPDAAGAAAGGGTLKSGSRPLPMHPGMK